jgi:phospholipid transport system substrate-binding protein
MPFIRSITLQSRWVRKEIAGLALALGYLLCLWVPQAVAIPNPLDTVKSGTEKVLRVLKERGEKRGSRRTEIRSIVDGYFDFEEIARRALGPSWNEQSPARQQEYVKAFSDFLFGIYISKVEKYTNQKITYKVGGETGNDATIQTFITGRQTGRIPIDYRLHLKDGAWKAYDVVIEGVGLVNNYRSQFSAILARGSFDDLLNKLRQKSAGNS